MICLSSCKIAATFHCCCCGAKVASRLFDVFLASHPLMPMYVGVAAMTAMRSTLLACGEMHEAHAVLSHIDLLDYRDGAATAWEEGGGGGSAGETTPGAAAGKTSGPGALPHGPDAAARPARAQVCAPVGGGANLVQ